MFFTGPKLAFPWWQASSLCSLRGLRVPQRACGAAAGSPRVPGPLGRRRTGWGQDSSHHLFLLVSCSCVKSVTPFEFWIIRFIYLFIFLSTFHFCLWSSFVCFSEGFPSALSHWGHLFYRVKDDCRRIWGVTMFIPTGQSYDALGGVCPFRDGWL